MVSGSRRGVCDNCPARGFSMFVLVTPRWAPYGPEDEVSARWRCAYQYRPLPSDRQQIVDLEAQAPNGSVLKSERRPISATAASPSCLTSLDTAELADPVSYTLAAVPSRHQFRFGDVGSHSVRFIMAVGR